MHICIWSAESARGGTDEGIKAGTKGTHHAQASLESDYYLIKRQTEYITQNVKVVLLYGSET